ncbi:hypothetical protein [Nonomuraea sp. CA-141351]|uniref:hypothetical protein n=1 Tax=Nonomuraea sp. CA-141351 TaxID=3239996 RepID=UPI003D8FA119
MAEKIKKPVLLAAVLGSGLALGSAVLAFGTAGPTAAYSQAAPTITRTTIPPTTISPYPPSPTASEVEEEEFEFDPREVEREDDFNRDNSDSFIRNQNDVDVEVDDRAPRRFFNNFHGTEEQVEEEHVGKELPFTGAPVATLAAAGGGLLIIGAAGTIIAVRRRRSASAK